MREKKNFQNICSELRGLKKIKVSRAISVNYNKIGTFKLIKNNGNQ